jgi:hypothetical protein
MAAAEASTIEDLRPTNVSSALALLDLLSASRPRLDQDAGATMIDALDGLSTPLLSSQALTVLRLAGVLANRTTELTEEMGSILFQITNRVLAGMITCESRAVNNRRLGATHPFAHLCIIFSHEPRMIPRRHVATLSRRRITQRTRLMRY